jgi:PTS system nitrogen regulatory IIA component
MEISSFVSLEAVVLDVSAPDKKQLLQILAQRIARIASLDERSVFDVLLQRERLGTTGVGRGVAIPHGRIANLDRVYGLFARLKPPIDFEAPDKEPVDLVFLLLAPAAAGADHLNALSRVSGLLRDTALGEKLRNAPDAKTAFAVLTAETASQAA